MIFSLFIYLFIYLFFYSFVFIPHSSGSYFLYYFNVFFFHAFLCNKSCFNYITATPLNNPSHYLYITMAFLNNSQTFSSRHRPIIENNNNTRTSIYVPAKYYHVNSSNKYLLTLISMFIHKLYAPYRFRSYVGKFAYHSSILKLLLISTTKFTTTTCIISSSI